MKHSEKVRLYENWGVSRNKTTACFRENDGSFCEKLRVVLGETTCRFLERNGGGMNDTEKCKLKNGEIEL